MLSSVGDELSFLFVYEICAVLEYYAALSGCCVPTFRDNLPSHLQGSRSLKIGPIGFPETSAQNYHSALRNISDERRSHLLRGGSLKSRLFVCMCLC